MDIDKLAILHFNSEAKTYETLPVRLNSDGTISFTVTHFSLDGIENEELRDPKKCYQHIKDAMKDDQKYYLLLDEVQFMPRFEEVLNSLLRISNIDVYVTGSKPDTDTCSLSSYNV